VVLLGSYFAARTLKQTRSDQRASRMLQAIELTASDRPVARIGAIGVLNSLAVSAERRREAETLRVILNVLDAVRRREQDASVSAVAEDAYRAVQEQSTSASPGAPRRTAALDDEGH
jgi:hypothetical protein